MPQRRLVLQCDLRHDGKHCRRPCRFWAGCIKSPKRVIYKLRVQAREARIRQSREPAFILVILARYY